MWCLSYVSYIANFLISKRGDVKVGDFGILRDMTSPHTSDPSHIGPTASAARGGGGAGSEVSGSTSPTRSVSEAPSAGHANDDDAAVGAGVREDEGKEGDDAGEDTAYRRSKLHRASTFVGTAAYMSPERIDGQEYGYPSDIWALGLSLLTVALGKLTIQTTSGYWGILQSVRDDEPPCIPTSDLRFSTDFRDFLSKCLQKDPNDRWTCQQLLTHPFVKMVNIEEVTYNVDDDMMASQGRKELREIVSILYTHIERMLFYHTPHISSHVPTTDSGTGPEDDCQSDEFWTLYGINLYTTDITATIQHVMLGLIIDNNSINNLFISTSNIYTSLITNIDYNFMGFPGSGTPANVANPANVSDTNDNTIEMNNKLIIINQIKQRQIQLNILYSSFNDSTWDEPLYSVRNLAYQLHITRLVMMLLYIVYRIIYCCVEYNILYVIV